MHLWINPIDSLVVFSLVQNDSQDNYIKETRLFGPMWTKLLCSTVSSQGSLKILIQVDIFSH
jgi:hypothetical protein